MQVQTYLFGSVEVAPENVISFPQGLVGFEHLRQFMLVHETDKGEPSSFTLQSLESPELAFQIVDPTAIGFNYELALNDAENAILQSPAPNDVAVMLVLFTQDSDEKAISASLRAPLLINTKARVGLQKLMEKLQSNVTLSNLAASV